MQMSRRFHCCSANMGDMFPTLVALFIFQVWKVLGNTRVVLCLWSKAIMQGDASCIDHKISV